MTNIGLDMGASTFDASFKKDERFRAGKFMNSRKGFNDLRCWLKKNGIPEPHLHMESTGRYGEALALWAYKNGWRVTVINPYRIRKHAESQGQYNKTDKIDAALVTDFADSGKARKIRLWEPRSQAETELRELNMEIAGVEKMISQERNRSKSCIATPLVRSCIRENIAHLKRQKEFLQQRALKVIKSDENLRQLYEVLIGIKGLGDKTIITLLAKINFDYFKKGRELVAFAGLAPRKWESGTSVRKKEIISRVGHADLRSALYFPAVVAMTYDPEMAQFKEHLLSQGKAKKLVICAVMARLLRKAFALVRDAKRAALQPAA